MNKRRGFTLIELMVVMAILAILLAIGAGAFTSSLRKGRDSTRKANLKAIANALEMYYNDKGQYPVATGPISGCYTTDLTTTGTCGKDYPVFRDSPPSNTVWMTKFPTDPVSSQTYYYRGTSTGGVTKFQIYAHLENSQDPGIITPNPALAPTACGGACNYGISSGDISP